jgi:hypothetical protein
MSATTNVRSSSADGDRVAPRAEATASQGRLYLTVG